MPIYEFICRECHGGFEKLVPLSRRDSVACPTCGSEKTARHISLTAPAQVRTGGSASPAMAGEGCGMPNCCGGMCAPNLS